MTDRSRYVITRPENVLDYRGEQLGYETSADIVLAIYEQCRTDAPYLYNVYKYVLIFGEPSYKSEQL